MPEFSSAEALVHWTLRYEVMPLAEDDPLLLALQRIERRARLEEPTVVLLAIRRRPGSPEPEE